MRTADRGRQVMVHAGNTSLRDAAWPASTVPRKKDGTLQTYVQCEELKTVRLI